MEKCENGKMRKTLPYWPQKRAFKSKQKGPHQKKRTFFSAEIAVFMYHRIYKWLHHPMVILSSPFVNLKSELLL